jgi:hypothetical protein
VGKARRLADRRKNLDPEKARQHPSKNGGMTAPSPAPAEQGESES